MIKGEWAGLFFIPKCPPVNGSQNSGRGMDWMECLLGVTTARVQGRAMSHILRVGSLAFVKMHSTEHLIQHKQLQSKGLSWALLPINLLKWKLSNAQHCLNRNDSYFSATHRWQNHRCQNPVYDICLKLQLANSSLFKCVNAKNDIPQLLWGTVYKCETERQVNSLGYFKINSAYTWNARVSH